MGWREGIRRTVIGQIIKFKLIGNLFIYLIIITTVTGQTLDFCSKTIELECCKTYNNFCPEGFKILSGGDKSEYCRQSIVTTTIAVKVQTSATDDSITTNPPITTRQATIQETPIREATTLIQSFVTTTNTAKDNDQNNLTVLITENTKDSLTNEVPPLQTNVSICVQHCPDGYVSIENNSRCDRHQIETDNNDENLVAIIGGTVGGVVVIVVVIVIAVCCCRHQNSRPSTSANQEGRRRRPLSELLHIKKKPKNNNDVEGNESGNNGSRNTPLRPPNYINMASHNPTLLASDAQQGLDVMTRYIKDPTAKPEEAKPSEKETNPYENQATIHLLKLQKSEMLEKSTKEEEKQDIENLPPAPPPPSTEDGSQDTNRDLRVQPDTGGPKKHALLVTPNKKLQNMHDSQKDLTQAKESGDDAKENYENFRFVAAGVKTNNAVPVVDNDPQEDYENLQDEKLKEPKSSDEENPEDYENVDGKDYINVPPKVTKK